MPKLQKLFGRKLSHNKTNNNNLKQQYIYTTYTDRCFGLISAFSIFAKKTTQIMSEDEIKRYNKEISTSYYAENTESETSIYEKRVTKRIKIALLKKTRQIQENYTSCLER